MDGAELYCFEDFESQLSPAEENNESTGKRLESKPLANGIDNERIDDPRNQTRSNHPGQNWGTKDREGNGQAETVDQLTVKLGHGNHPQRQQDGRLDHPAFLGKSQGCSEGRQIGNTAGRQRYLHRGRTVDIADSGPGGAVGLNRVRRGHLIRSQSMDEGKDVQRGPRELVSYSEKRKLQLNQITRSVKTSNVTEISKDIITHTNEDNMQGVIVESSENTDILDHVDKLSVRARPDVNLVNKKNAKMRECPPIPALRPGRSGSPRSWNFSTQSIVPRFANRDDSEILLLSERVPLLKASLMNVENLW